MADYIQNIADPDNGDSNKKLEKKDNFNTSGKKVNNADEFEIDKIYRKAEQEFDEELLEKYNHKLMLQKKFKYISEDPNIQKISLLDESIRKKFEIPKFRKFSRSDEKLSQQGVLKKDFKDFLILREFSGRTKNYPHSSRIPSEFVKKTNKIIRIEDPPVFFESDESSEKPTVIFHKNKDGQLELIEVICSCGEKVFIEIEYNQDKMLSYSPAIASNEDIDKNAGNNVPNIMNNNSDNSKENEQEINNSDTKNSNNQIDTENKK